MQMSLSPSRNHEELDSPGSSVFDLPNYNQHVTGGAADDSQANLSESILTDRPSRHSAGARTTNEPSFLVISGGTGGNSICTAFGTGNNTCYVLPVSDDGGSSSEIIRVLGGPSIGDIRSRLIRLIPSAPPSSPLDAIRTLLSYRLPTWCSEREARDEWRDIVEGRSPLWTGIPNDRKETIRGFLVYFESEVLKRAHKNFSFLNGSIGNYFLAAAQGFFRSLPSAIFLFSSITSSQANILPVIVTNHTVTIAAELEDGEKLVGQCEISHPVITSGPSVSVTTSASSTTAGSNSSIVFDSVSPSSPTMDGMGEVISQRHNVMFEASSKDEYEPLESRIHRLYYINAYGHEIHPSPNPDYMTRISSSNVLVYSCGSLWTSIIPCLALKGVATAIARSRSLRAKILLLNSANDRETDGYTAVDYVNAIIRTMNTRYDMQPYGLGNASTSYPVSAFITHLVYLGGSAVGVDVARLSTMGVRSVRIEGAGDVMNPRFDAERVRRAIDGILAGGD